jgi:hypothetical protein
VKCFENGFSLPNQIQERQAEKTFRQSPPSERIVHQARMKISTSVRQNSFRPPHCGIRLSGCLLPRTDSGAKTGIGTHKLVAICAVIRIDPGWQATPRGPTFVLAHLTEASTSTSKWWAGRESNPDLQLRTLPCCSVTLPTHLELAPGIQPGSLR